MEADMLNILLGVYLLGSLTTGGLLWTVLVAARRHDQGQGYDTE